MKWQNLRKSGNIEDRRSLGGKVTGGAGGLFALALVVYLLGGDPSALVMEGVSRSIQTSASHPSKLTPEQQEEQADFVSAVLGSTEDVWGEKFSQQGLAYEAPSLVLFAGAVDSACGLGQAAMGPFYCPLDRKVYLDLDFFYELEHRHDAPGDFARAYVVAHEVGHHVQNLLEKLPARKSNAMSVKVELQADCYAGIWAHEVGRAQLLDEGDLQEALRTASQIGDDHLQKETQGYAVPDSFTHGSSDQRMKWLRRGYDSGQIEDCDTLNN